MLDPVLFVIILNAIVFAFPFIVPFRGDYDSFTNFQLLGLMNKSDVKDGEWYRLFTSNFLHADIVHILVNMYSLYNLGGNVLSIFRPAGFALIYITSGITGSLFSFLFNQSASRGSLGASGAIMGLLGALLSFVVVTGRTEALAPILINIVIIGLYGFLIPQIDNWAHIGGFLCGAVVGLAWLYFKQIGV
jgi:rhomboid protease GluP